MLGFVFRAGKWWDFCDDPDLDSTWDKYVCDLHFQDSDFAVVDGKRNKNYAAVPSIKGEELKQKMKTLGITKENISELGNIERNMSNEDIPDNTLDCPEQCLPSVSAEKVLDKSLIEPLKNISKNCPLFIKDLPNGNQKLIESTPLESTVGSGAHVKQCMKVPVSQLKNLKFAFDRQLVQVSNKELVKKYKIKSHKKIFSKESVSNLPVNSLKEKLQSSSHTTPKITTPLNSGKKAYANQSLASNILKEQTKVSSPTKVNKFTSNESPAKKNPLISSAVPLSKAPRLILPKPVGGNASGVDVSSLNTRESTTFKNILISSRNSPWKALGPVLSKPEIGNSSGSKVEVPLPSFKNIDTNISLVSGSFEGPLNANSPQTFIVTSSSSTNKKLPLSSLVHHVNNKLTTTSSDSNIDVPRYSSQSSNISQKLSTTTIFSNSNSSPIDTIKIKPLFSSKRSKKDVPTIKIKRRKFNNVKRELEVTTHFQRRTLSKRYQRSSRTTIDLSNPKYSIAATAKSLDKTFTASENSLEKVNLNHGEWDKLFVPGKTIFSPTTTKSNISAIIHHLRQRLPYLNDRDKLEVRFLLNMMSMYPVAPDHLKQQLVERLNLVYVATLFKWETAISMAVDNKSMTDLENAGK